MSVSETIVIEAPPALVWALIDDPDRLSSWIPELVETQYPDGRPRDGGPDVVFRQVLMRSGTPTIYDGRVTEFKRGERLAVALSDGTMTVLAKYRLASDGNGGTRLDFEGDIQMHNPLVGLLMVTVWPVTRSMMIEQLQRLKAVAEAEAAAQSTPTKVALSKPRPAKARTRKASVVPKDKAKSVSERVAPARKAGTKRAAGKLQRKGGR